MDFLLLPEKIKKALSDIGIEQPTILSILRAGGSLEGAAGEGYLVSCDDRLALFSRKMGEDSYRGAMINYQDPGLQMSIRKDKFHSILEIVHNGESKALRFSSYEERCVQPVLDAWHSAASKTKSPCEQAPAPQKEPLPAKASLSPMASAAASLMYLSTIDGVISETEDHYIRLFCHDSEKELKDAFAYYKSHSFDELLDELSGLDQQQALCILANMMELAMLDGLFRSSEQNMLWHFAESLGLTRDEYQTVKDVLLIKQQTSVLKPGEC